MKPQPLPREWYVVRTAPGAQLPRREYVTERTRSRKGHRIVPSINTDLSAVEKALADAGFSYYMPAEKRLLKDRLRPYPWKHRRFAMLVGYVVVHAPHSVDALEQVPGVVCVLHRLDTGEPLTISVVDVVRIKAAEAQAEVRSDQASREARATLRTGPRRRTRRCARSLRASTSPVR